MDWKLGAYALLPCYHSATVCCNRYLSRFWLCVCMLSRQKDLDIHFAIVSDMHRAIWGKACFENEALLNKIPWFDSTKPSLLMVEEVHCFRYSNVCLRYKSPSSRDSFQPHNLSLLGISSPTRNSFLSHNSSRPVNSSQFYFSFQHLTLPIVDPAQFPEFPLQIRSLFPEDSPAQPSWAGIWFLAGAALTGNSYAERGWRGGASRTSTPIRSINYRPSCDQWGAPGACEARPPRSSRRPRHGIHATPAPSLRAS